MEENNIAGTLLAFVFLIGGCLGFLALFMLVVYAVWDIHLKELEGNNENERMIDRLDRAASLMNSTPSRSLEQARVRGVRKHAQQQAEARAKTTVENVRQYRQQVREKEEKHDPSATK